MTRAPLPSPSEAGGSSADGAEHWVVVNLLLTPDGRASVNGRRIDVPPGDDARLQMLVEAGRIAGQLGRDIGVTATDPSGTQHFIARRNGAFDLIADAPWATAQVPETAPAPAAPAPSRSSVPSRVTADGPVEARPEAPGSAGPDDEASEIGPGLVASPWSPPARRTPGPRPSSPKSRGPGQALSRRHTSFGAGLGLAVLVIAAVVAAALIARPGAEGQEGGKTVAQSRGAADAAPSDQGNSAIPPSTQVALATLPEGLPGFGVKPTWGTPVAGFSRISYLDGRLALRAPDGRLQLLDATNGKVTWQGRTQWQSEWSGPALTRIDGKPVMVLASNTSLVYWPLDTLGGKTTDEGGAATASAGAGPDGSVQLALPPRSRVIWTGTTPLIVLGTRAWLVKGPRLQLMALPPGAQPITADSGAVIAVQGAIWVRSTGATYASHAVAVPPGVTGPPVRTVDVAGRFLLVVWPKRQPTQAITFIDTSTGRVLLNNRLPVGVDVTKAAVLRQSSGSVIAVGQVVIDPDRQRINALLAQYTPRVLASGRVYAADSGVRAPDNLVEIRLPEFTVSRLGAKSLMPFATTTLPGQQSATAFVLASASGGWQVLAVPATG